MTKRRGATKAAMKAEIDLLRREIERLSVDVDDRPSEAPPMTMPSAGSLARDAAAGENVYVLDDDADEARAFDEFYRAYDEVHAKTRQFLLG